MSTYIIWGSEINRLRDAINAMEAQLSERAARIEALEAALRIMLTDPPAALDEPDTDAEVIQHYREVARAALAPEQDK